MANDWNAVKAQLGSPNLSADDKKRLLESYLALNGGSNYDPGYTSQYQSTDDYNNNADNINGYAKNLGVDADAVANYRKQVDPTYRDGGWSGAADPSNEQALKDDLNKQFGRATASGDKNQANTDLGNAAKTTVAQGGPGAKTSDELLDPGAKGLQYFQLFIPPYKDWTGYAPDFNNDIKGVYDKLRGIQFARFRADAATMDTSHTNLDDAGVNINASTNSLWSFWQGLAAQRASAYCASFNSDAKTVIAGVATASQTITATMKAIETQVLTRAQNVLQLWADEINGHTPDEIELLIKVARNQASDTELKSIAKWSEFRNVDWSDTDCGGGLSQNIKNLAAADASAWLDQNLKGLFDQHKSAFDQICTSTHEAVGKQYDAMNQALGQIKADPFADLKNGMQGSGTGSGSGGSGTTGSGGGGAAMPKVPTPSVAMPAPTSTLGAAGTPTIPSTVTPSTTTPSSTTGAPVTVTSHNADGSSMAITGATGDGDIKVTTDDGSGKRQSYDVNFGQGGTGTVGAGATGTAAGTTGATGLTGGSGTVGATGTVGAGTTGATGPGSPTTSSGVHHVTADASGKAVIHDGKETISVQEPTGEKAPIKLALSDAAGKTETYEIDPASSTGTAGTPAAGAGAPGSGALAGGSTSTDPVSAGAAPAGTPGSNVTTGTASPAAGGYQPGGPTGAASTATVASHSEASSAAGAAGGYPTAQVGLAAANSPGGSTASDILGTTTVASVVSPGLGDLGGAVGGGDLGAAGGPGDLGGAVGGGDLGGSAGGGAGLASVLGDGAGQPPGAGQGFGGDLGASHGSLGGPVDHSAGPAWPTTDHAGLAGVGAVEHPGVSSSAGLASAPGGETAPSGQFPTGSGMSLGGMGGGGAGGGDQQRGASHWRVAGQLFDDDGNPGGVTRLSGALDDDTSGH